MGVRLLVGHADEPSGTASFDFDQTRITLGRGHTCDVRLPHRAVSQHHATIRLDGGQWVLVDEGSTNGTTATSGKLVAGRPKPLRSGDTFQIAGIPFTFLASVAFSEPTTPERTAAQARRMLRELFAPEARVLEPASLVVRAPNAEPRRVELGGDMNAWRLGRDETCAVRLDDAGNSAEHATVVRDDAGLRIVDRDSKNGTFVGGKRVQDKRLRDGDEIALGAVVLVVEDPADRALRALERDDDEPGAAPWMPKTETSAPAPPQAAAPEMSRASADAATPSSATTTRFEVDRVVFIVAAVVLVVSLAGLAWLLGAG